MREIGVGQAAAELGVSERRVRALLAAGRLPGRKVGRDWLVEPPKFPDHRLRAARRPMSGNQAWNAIAILSGQVPAMESASRSRLRARLPKALNAAKGDPIEVAGVLRAWLPRRAVVAKFHAAALPHRKLRADPRIQLSGVSHPLAGIADSNLVEAYVKDDDLASIERGYHLVPARDGNVLLHIVSAPQGKDFLSRTGVSSAVVAADLADHDDARAVTAAANLLEVSP